MAKILDMPKLSPTMEEGVLSTWHKKEGDASGVDDLLAEVETDKATMEFRAFDKGTLLKILVPRRLAGEAGAAGRHPRRCRARTSRRWPRGPRHALAPPAAPSPQAADRDPAPKPQAQTAAARAAPELPVETLAPARPAPPSAVVNVLDRTAYAGEPTPEGTARALAGRVLASPYVRKVARELGIDLQGAPGTGPGGRIVPGRPRGHARRPCRAAARPRRARDQPARHRRRRRARRRPRFGRCRRCARRSRDGSPSRRRPSRTST